MNDINDRVMGILEMQANSIKAISNMIKKQDEYITLLFQTTASDRINLVDELKRCQTQIGILQEANENWKRIHESITMNLTKHDLSIDELRNDYWNLKEIQEGVEIQDYETPQIIHDLGNMMG